MTLDSTNEGQQIINLIDLVMDELHEVARNDTADGERAYRSLARMRTIRGIVCFATDAAEPGEGAIEQARRQVGGRG